LAQDLLERMASNGADFTLTFRRLCDAVANSDVDVAVRSLFANAHAFDDWAARWRQRLAEEGGGASERQAAMRTANPAFIPRNHLVEEAISAAVSKGDFSLLENLLDVLARPYEDQPTFGRYAEPPRPEQVVAKRFAALDPGRNVRRSPVKQSRFSRPFELEIAKRETPWTSSRPSVKEGSRFGPPKRRTSCSVQ
jgi:uncharacterized protein YdiU (UPF0061 family)